MSKSTNSKATSRSKKEQEIRQIIDSSLEKDGVVILPPNDVERTLVLVDALGYSFNTAILDPWYNKGVGGERDDYQEFILRVLEETGEVSQHIYLWGFPEIIAPMVERIPKPLELVCWLTWFYENNPSVIKGWRSAQQTCLHISKPNADLYPEHFLNETQQRKLDEGKLRYMPAPPSVIEVPLNVGFVGQDEQTDHDAQKPEEVFKRILKMTTKEDHLVLDPMSGAGTTGAVVDEFDAKAILCDISDEYTQIAEERLGVERISIGDKVEKLLKEIDESLTQTNLF